MRRSPGILHNSWIRYPRIQTLTLHRRNYSYNFKAAIYSSTVGGRHDEKQKHCQYISTKHSNSYSNSYSYSHSTRHQYCHYVHTSSKALTNQNDNDQHVVPLATSTNNNNNYYEYLTSKRGEMERLNQETNDMLSRYDKLPSHKSATTDMATKMINLLKKWHEFNSSIIVVPNSNQYKKRRNRFSYLSTHANDISNTNNQIVEGEGDSSLLDNSTFVYDLIQCKEQCAQSMEDVLAYHIKYNIRSNVILPTKHATVPFMLVMDAWNQNAATVTISHAGSKTAAVLESWGECYGGDMDLAPTIQEFNVVLDACAKSSSGDYGRFSIEKSFPAELAWDIYSFLCQLNDVSLLPNVASCVHMVHALTHHAFVMKYSSSSSSSSGGYTANMDADVAAIRAFSVWKHMLDKVEKEDGVDPSLLWKAHNDVIGLSSHGMLRRDEVVHEKIFKGGNIFATVGCDTEKLLNQVFHLGGSEEFDSTHPKQAFLSAMFAWTKEQEEWIAMAMAYESDDNCNDLVDAVTRAALSAEALLAKMKENNLSPSAEHYHAVIRAYFNCLDSKVLRADTKGKVKEDLLPHVACFQLLEEMDKTCIRQKSKESDKVLLTEKIPASMYEDVISAFLRAHEDGNTLLALSWDDVTRVHGILNRMMDLYERNMLWIERSRQPLTFALNYVLRLYSQSDVNCNESFQKSSSLLRRFNKIRANRNIQLNAVTYSTYLTTLSKSNSKDAVAKALDVLKEMEDNGIDLNIPSYTLVIKIIGSSKGEENIPIAHQLVQKAFEKYHALPYDEKEECGFNGSALYSSLISAKINSGNNDSSEAIRLLKSLKTVYDNSNDDNLKPDVIMYGAVLNSISKKPSNFAVQSSLQILDEMESMYQQGHVDLLPTKHCYTSVINTLSKSGLVDACKQAEDILERMESLYKQTREDSVKPDHIVYSSVLQTYSRSKSPVDTGRAEELMNIMEAKAKNGEIAWPNASAYTALINVIKNSRSKNVGEKAEAVIDRMDKAYSNGNHHVRADTYVFCAVLNAWASSGSPQKVKKAWQLFNRMCQRYDSGDIVCKPNVTAFNLVLNVCSYNKNKSSHDDSVRVALLTQEKLLGNTAVYGHPDGDFFNRLIKVFGFCISDPIERHRFISKAFERCAKDGQVNDFVLESLKRFAPQAYETLLGKSDDRVSTKNLPEDWSRNSYG